MASKREQQEAAGRWLRETRERRGYQTAGALARKIGVSDSLISRIETGITAASDERAEQIAEALGMDVIDVRRGLALWVPPADREDAPPPETAEDELLERIRQTPPKRRRIIEALLDDDLDEAEPDRDERDGRTG